MQRLQTRPQFQAVLAGETVARTAHFALHRCVLEAQEELSAPLPSQAGERRKPLFAEPDVWLGAMVPKRWARRAVTRNAIRRQIHGVGQAHAALLPRAAHVVRLRAAFDRKHFVSAWSEPLRLAVRAELQQLFARACRPARPAPPPGAHEGGA